jgi:hypothetical protein
MTSNLHHAAETRIQAHNHPDSRFTPVGATAFRPWLLLRRLLPLLLMGRDNQALNNSTPASVAAPHTLNSSSRPQRRKMVASAAARIWTPHFLGKAATGDPGRLANRRPAPSMPTTRGRRS